METATNKHSAVPAALGYYHQSLYGLVALLDADDDESVSIETADDVELHGKVPTLHQIKSSQGKTASLTDKCVPLWKTLCIWCTSQFRDTAQFLLVTQARISTRSCLQPLTFSGSDRSTVCDALQKIAREVLETRKQQKKDGKRLSFKSLAPGCKAFLSLKRRKQEHLLSRIQIRPSSFATADIPAVVAERLRTVLPPDIRILAVERLIEWWDRRIALGLLRQSPRFVSKLELQHRVHEIVSTLHPDSLPDDFGSEVPESIESELGGIMEQQIELVDGGADRIKLAALARWRARNQRERWLTENLAMASALTAFDSSLTESWEYLFKATKHDSRESSDDEKRKRGRDLLDWSQTKAPSEVPPLRHNWTKPYLVQGSFHELADGNIVGWHPDYDALLQSPR